MTFFHLRESSTSLDPQNVEIYAISSSFYFSDTKSITSSKIIANDFWHKTVFHKDWIKVLESFVNF